MATLSALLFAATALAQGTKYGENHVVTQFDSQVVEQRAFPAPDVTLYSPAFLSNASFAPGWTEGTEGATSQADLGKGDWRRIKRLHLTVIRRVSPALCAEKCSMGDVWQCRLPE